MNDDHPLPAIAADALFVIACPTCLGQLSAMAGLASRRACCPLCAATFVIPEPRISSRSTPPAEPSARHQAPLPTSAVPSGTSESPAEPAMPSIAVEAATDNAAPTDVALVFQEPVRTIGSGAAAVELRRLSDEERRLRRSRRSLILLLVGAAVLVAIVVILGMPARPR